MKKPEWITPHTLIEKTDHPTAEAWVEEHVNPETDEHAYLAIDTSGSNGGLIGAYSNFGDACNAIGEQYGFDDFWVGQ